MNKLTVVIKTFMRPKTCENLVILWRNFYGPELKIIVIDDGKINPSFLNDYNTRHEIIQFDSGASLGRNIGVKLVDTEFVFYSDDDNTPPNPEALQKCMDILSTQDVDIIGCGAFKLSINNGMATIKRQKIVGDFSFCDFTLQHFLAKKSRMLLWNESLKISGEHFDYFMRCLKEKIKVAGTNMLKFKKIVKDSRQNVEEYNKFRKRKEFAKNALKIWNINGVKWIH